MSVTRDDLVGQYIGHTAPKTREVLKRAMGGVLFIDEAYYLYRTENERDYGQEAIEILLQVMENERDDLVVILAGYRDRMDTFFQANPGMGSRIAHHIDFPDYTEDELMRIAHLMLAGQGYEFSPEAETAFGEYLTLRREQPRFREREERPQRARAGTVAPGGPPRRRDEPAALEVGPRAHRGRRHPEEPRLRTGRGRGRRRLLSSRRASWARVREPGHRRGGSRPWPRSASPL